MRAVGGDVVREVDVARQLGGDELGSLEVTRSLLLSTRWGRRGPVEAGQLDETVGLGSHCEQKSEEPPAEGRIESETSLCRRKLGTLKRRVRI